MFLNDNQQLTDLIAECLSLDSVQFWLDCSTMSPVISAVQKTGRNILYGLFKLSRNYCHTLHKARCNLLEV